MEILYKWKYNNRFELKTIVAKGEIAHYEQFHLLPQSFHESSAAEGVCMWEMVNAPMYSEHCDEPVNSHSSPRVREVAGSIPDRVIPNSLKMVVMALPPWRSRVAGFSITTDWLVSG